VDYRRLAVPNNIVSPIWWRRGMRMDIPLRLRYMINDSYNRRYVRSRQIFDAASVVPESLTNASPNREFSTPFMTVWLKNIDRIIAGARVDCRLFHFLDVGCGKGVAAIYARDRFQFASVSGFDFEDPMVNIAKSNLALCRARRPIGHVEFFHQDAGEIALPKRRWFVFMFNPFSAPVMERFLANNITVLRETGSVVGYANSREIDVIKNFAPRSITEIPRYRCAVIKF